MPKERCLLDHPGNLISRKPTLCSPSGAHTLLEVPSHCRQGKRTHLALEGADDFSSFFYHHPPGLPGWCHHPPTNSSGSQPGEQSPYYLVGHSGGQAKAQVHHSLRQTHLCHWLFPELSTCSYLGAIAPVTFCTPFAVPPARMSPPWGHFPSCSAGGGQVCLPALCSPLTTEWSTCVYISVFPRGCELPWQGLGPT